MPRKSPSETVNRITRTLKTTKTYVPPGVVADFMDLRDLRHRQAVRAGLRQAGREALYEELVSSERWAANVWPRRPQLLSLKSGEAKMKAIFDAVSRKKYDRERLLPEPWLLKAFVSLTPQQRLRLDQMCQDASTEHAKRLNEIGVVAKAFWEQPRIRWLLGLMPKGPLVPGGPSRPSGRAR